MRDNDPGGRIQAAADFVARRGELDMTQEDVAREGDVAVRTVVNLESQGVWPNARTRAKLEKAIGWPPGELEKRARTPALITEKLRQQIHRDYDKKTASRIIGLVEQTLVSGSGEEPAEGNHRG